MSSSWQDEPGAGELPETAFRRRVNKVPTEIGWSLASDDIDPAAAGDVDSEPEACKALRIMADLWDEVDGVLTTFMQERRARIVHEQRTLTVGILRFAMRCGWRFEDVVNAARPGMIDPDSDPVLETTIERHFYEVFFDAPDWEPTPEWISRLCPAMEGQHFDIMRYWLVRDAAAACADRFAASGFAFLPLRAFRESSLAGSLLVEHRQMLLALVTFAKLTGIRTNH